MSNQKKPDQVYPSSTTSTPSPMPLYIPDVSLKGESFDQLIQNRGIRFLHRKAAPCPNMRTIFDNSHNPNCPICDNSGIFYYEEKEVFGLFYSNSLEKNLEYQGVWEIGTAVVTLPTEYTDGKQAEFLMFDQLVIPDFTVRMWELKEYRPTTNRRQSLRYDVFNIEYMACAQEDELVVFEVETDFNIVDGEIEWVAGRQPNFNTETDRGDILVVQYYANPVYTVLNHLRELRISQQYVNGTKIAKRLPQQVLVKRDFFQHQSEKEE